MASKLTLKVKKFKEIIRFESIEFLKILGIKKILSSKVEADRSAVSEINAESIDFSRRAIIVLPNITWGYRTQRPQHIFSRLAKKGFNIFWVSQFTSDKETVGKIDENIYQLNLKTLNKGKLLRDFHIDDVNAQEAFQSIKRLIGGKLKNDSILFTLHPAWYYLTQKFKQVIKIYDLMDLYEGFTDSKTDLVEKEKELISQADLVFATADNLLKNAKDLNPNSFLIRNGADYDNFKEISPSGVLDCISKKKIIGYFGSMSDWLDVKSIEYLAKNNPDLNLVFIGKINGRSIRHLYKYRNIYLLGEIEYPYLRCYLAYFDVCIIPFIINDLIQNTDPVKFYEYISAGKPVVSNMLPELQKYKDICYLYKSPNSFNRNIMKALKENDPKIVAKRKIIARNNSWDKRVIEILNCISSIE